MTHLVLDACVNCRYTDCANTCPVQCFFLGANTVAIHPDECIDCGACVDACPVKAIVPDADLTTEEQAIWLQRNRENAELWKDRRLPHAVSALPNADDFKDEKGKYEKYFDPAPGEEIA